MAIYIDPAVYRDKVKGAWLGKVIGGTLGAPFEGRTQLLALDYYTPVPAQAAPNDDLDLQLVWLDALKRIGPSIGSSDLAQAWLDHIIYPYDEYGFAKGNLKRGLLPPVTGAFNNPFFDCMGAAIRSEIWALIAPGAPALAAQYAYQDGSIDHKEDGIWGEMFFAALESAAFVVSAPKTLIEIGRSMIPSESNVNRVIQAVLNAHNEGASWQDARGQVLQGYGSPNFTSAPQNIGFTLIGWLWNQDDFGKAICGAVNCGYDTDCTGATLGAILGILSGASKLPENWLRPIGPQVVAGWGIKEVEIPETIEDLTDQTLAIGEKVLAERAPQVQLSAPPAPVIPPPPPPPAVQEIANIADAPPSNLAIDSAQAAETPIVPPPAPGIESPASQPDVVLPPPSPVDANAESAPTPVIPPPPPQIETTASAAPAASEAAAVAPAPPAIDTAVLSDNSSVKPLWTRNPLSQDVRTDGLSALFSFEEPPTIVPGITNRIIANITNTGSEGLTGVPKWTVPSGWELAARQDAISLAPGSRAQLAAVVRPPKDIQTQPANPIGFSMAEKSVTFHLARAMQWGVVGPFANIEGTGFNTYYPPEDNADPKTPFMVRSNVVVYYETVIFRDCFFDIDRFFRNATGTIYMRTWMISPQAQEGRLAIFCNDGVRVWLNKQALMHYHDHDPFIPRVHPPYSADVQLNAGENELLIKIIRCADPLNVVFYMTDRDGHQLTDLEFKFER